MMLPEKVITDSSVEIAKNTTSGFISYALHMWFGGFYKDFLKTKIALSKEAEILAKKEIMEKYGNTDLGLIEKMKISESEIEYKNMAGVLSRIDGKISENAEGNIDPDKMKRLKDLSKEYSSEEMQEYIAKILAGEYNKSGTYSLQTLEILKSISKEELEIFQDFKKILMNNDFVLEGIFSDVQAMKRLEIRYTDLLLLNSLGLISLTNSIQQYGELKENDIVQLIYNGRPLFIKFKKEYQLSDLYFLTRSGKEISSLLEDNYNQYYIDYLKEYLKNKDIELGTEIPF